MKILYMLCASGSSIHPQIDIAIHETDIEHVKKEALKRAAILEPAGYYTFTLFDLHDDNHHKVIGSIKVETTKPVASFK